MRWTGLFKWQLPSKCGVCRSWPSRQVCADCMGRFDRPASRCRTCALELPADTSLGVGSRPDQCRACLLRPFGLDACYAAVPYAYPWSGLISRYKYSGHTGWASLMAELLLAENGVRELLTRIEPDDWLLPMPLADERLQWRGFNQAWLLAQAVHQQSKSRCGLSPSLLLRIRPTRPQSQLKRHERLDNVKGAFAVEPLLAEKLQNRRVVLIDDVMTSGASVLTAAGALRAAGASEVSAMVVARTAPAYLAPT